MQEKTITIIIDEKGSSPLDLEGFAGQGCERVFDDFRGGDSVKVERKSLPSGTNRPSDCGFTLVEAASLRGADLAKHYRSGQVFSLEMKSLGETMGTPLYSPRWSMSPISPVTR